MTNIVKSKLTAALDKLGHTNGHSCPDSQDPAVELMHEYYVSTIGEAYFKKRREDAKKKLVKSLTAVNMKSVDKMVDAVRENQVADTCTVLETSPYVLQVDIKNGASFLDTGKLKIALARDCKMSMTQVEQIIERCTDRRDPSKGWKVVER